MSEERGLLGRMWDHFKERLAAFPAEVEDMVERKTVQGAAELAQALNSQANAYVPYGAGQKALEVDGPQQSWQDQVREAAARELPDRGNEMER
jgi:hypothetical protein